MPSNTCLERATVATALVWFAAREAATYAEHIIDAGRREPAGRLAHFLLEMLTRLQAIGDVIGLSAPHVYRMRAELKQDGLIATSGCEVRSTGRAALQILAEFHQTYLARSPIRRSKR
jgi:CRP-like cAMP-binding protein